MGGFRFKVHVSGFKVYGFGFRVGSWVQGFGISIRALGRVYDFGFGL